MFNSLNIYMEAYKARTEEGKIFYSKDNQFVLIFKIRVSE
jgi:hypothetical protein